MKRPRARRRGAPSALRKGLMGLAVAACFLWLVETGLWLAGFQAAFSGESIAGWRTASNLHQHSFPNNGVAFSVSTNDAGLRTALPRQRTPGVRRIALMGDSTVFGWGVDEGGTVADGLAAAVAADHPDLGPLEVLNAGQPGYSSFQAAWLFDEVVDEWTPDLTILFIPKHDANLVLVSDREQIEGGSGIGARVRVTLARHSRLYGLLRGFLFQNAGRAAAIPADYADPEPRVPRVSPEDRGAAVARMMATAGAWGGQVAIGVLPGRVDLTHAETSSLEAQWAGAQAERLGIGFYDLRRCCGATSEHLVLPHDPGHLTTQGNLAVGRFLAEQLAGGGDRNAAGR